MQKQNKQQENIFISADKVDEPNNIAFDWFEYIFTIILGYYIF
jgi:hypothetical protein